MSGETETPQSPSVERHPGIGPRHWARLEGWGMAVHSLGYLHQPTTVEEIRAVFDTARETGKPVALRGGGRSYGDASIGEDSIVLDVSRMNRILAWDPSTGIVEAEPGVTLEQLWRKIIGDGWWPAVVSGTMYTTLAGCAAMNIHGKNNFRVGTFGDQVLDFDLMLPSGEVLTCSRDENAELFHAAISGFGMLGCFTRFRLKTKKVHSGLVRVEAFDTHSIGEMADELDARAGRADYLVGWIDCLARGRAFGRGIVHQANYLHEGEDPNPANSLTQAAQDLPARLFGVMPKSMMWMFIKPFINDIGTRFINATKFHSGKLQPQGHTYLQSHAAFAFLLDYVPNWKLAYRPGGLIQYQAFLTHDTAVAGHEKLVRMAQEAGLPPYLGVFKKHRPDPFLLTHALDGFSLALDFRVTKRNRDRLWKLAEQMDEVVLDHGGKFYFAKDATLHSEILRRYLPEGALDKFIELKHRCDPDNVLQTNLSRRLLSAYLEG
ncbi:FAD-binding protein [candidate division BRC1 bacterium HGW-BRC1-1]|nr:MAG: FAD-binding protein [candidate division BRC1 bacterium HGW-BRC1-1]